MEVHGPRGLHRCCGFMYERVAPHCPAEIHVPVSHFFLWYYYGGRCWAVLFQPDDSGSLGSSLVPCWWRWGGGWGQFLLWCLSSSAFIFYTFSLLLYCPLPGSLAKEIRLFLRSMFFIHWCFWVADFFTFKSGMYQAKRKCREFTQVTCYHSAFSSLFSLLTFVLYVISRGLYCI